MEMTHQSMLFEVLKGYAHAFNGVPPANGKRYVLQEELALIQKNQSNLHAMVFLGQKHPNFQIDLNYTFGWFPGILSNKFQEDLEDLIIDLSVSEKLTEPEDGVFGSFRLRQSVKDNIQKIKKIVEELPDVPGLTKGEWLQIVSAYFYWNLVRHKSQDETIEQIKKGFPELKEKIDLCSAMLYELTE